MPAYSAGFHTQAGMNTANGGSELDSFMEPVVSSTGEVISAKSGEIIMVLNTHTIEGT